ncbi:hypothetical protein SLE2022_261150 [Rubroshorea leprosula]
MEAVILVDVLRHAGAEVTLAFVEPQPEVEASSGTILVVDASESSCSNQVFDLVALPKQRVLGACELWLTIVNNRQ